MKKIPRITLSELASLERGKEVFLEAAPLFSILGEKLAAVDDALKAIYPESDSPIASIRRSMLDEEVNRYPEIFRSAERILAKGMQDPGYIPKVEELRVAQSVNAMGVSLLGAQLSGFRDRLEGEETAAAHTAIRAIDDCMAYIKNTVVPELQRYNFDGNIGKANLSLHVRSERKKAARFYTQTIVAGLMLLGLGGWARAETRKAGGNEVPVDIMMGMGGVFVAAGVASRIRQRRHLMAQEKGEEDSPDFSR